MASRLNYWHKVYLAPQYSLLPLPFVFDGSITTNGSTAITINEASFQRKASPAMQMSTLKDKKRKVFKSSTTSYERQKVRKSEPNLATEPTLTFLNWENMPKTTASSVAILLITFLVVQAVVLTLADRDDVDAGEYDEMWLAKRWLNKARSELRKRHSKYGLCKSTEPENCIYRS